MKIKTWYKICLGTPIITISGLYLYIQFKSKSKPKLNIIFDLDETLIHTEKITNYSNSNNSNTLKPEPYEITSNRKIWIRPGLYTVIPILAKFNNLYLFTKATEPYTLDILEKTYLNKYFVDKKYREDCKGTCKDVNKFSLEGYSLLVDDKISNQCGKQNFYHIPKFNCWTKCDIEMFKLFGWIVWLNILNDFNKL
jgi:hypothetical protein